MIDPDPHDLIALRHEQFAKAYGGAFFLDILEQEPAFVRVLFTPYYLPQHGPVSLTHYLEDQSGRGLYPNAYVLTSMSSNLGVMFRYRFTSTEQRLQYTLLWAPSLEHNVRRIYDPFEGFKPPPEPATVSVWDRLTADTGSEP